MSNSWQRSLVQYLSVVDDSVEITSTTGDFAVPDTSFRTWMQRLNNVKGARPEWPILLSWMLEREFNREQLIERPYVGPSVLIDRTNHNYNVRKKENRAVYGLCHRCWAETKGCLNIGDMRVWLLSYEVPNQDDHDGRCADLVGLKSDGGLVVFEGKLGKNSYPPISAILEGLDYLSCLTSSAAFERLIKEFHDLREQIPVPDGFETVEPNPLVPPMVIVLADSVCFDCYDISGRSPGWREMVRYGQYSTSVSIRFARAECDADGFFSRDVSWLV